MERNGSVRLIYWIMNLLLMLAVVGLGAWANDISERTSAADKKAQEFAIAAVNMQRDVTELKEQICLMQISIDNLREELTRKSVYRRPCP